MTDEQRKIRNLRQVLRRRATTCTRSEYYWPTTRTLDPYTRRYGNADEISRELALLRDCAKHNAVQSYVNIWTKLNHLKG